MARKEKKYHFIYKTTNLISGKYYYGMHSTNDLSDGYMGSGKRLRYSLKKYGSENHKREIVEFCKNRKELISREKEIVNLNEISKKECMNLRVGGSGTKKKYGITEETRKKMSKNNSRYWKNNKIPIEVKQKISKTLKGHLVDIETRQKISKTKKGYLLGQMSDETKQKISKAHKGKILSDETKQKISKSHQGKKLSETHKKNIGKSLKGRVVNIETKEKISKSHQGKKMSVIAKQNMSISHKGKGFKKILQMTLDDKVIQIWNSITDAANELNLNHSHISNCCNKKRKTTGGFKWKFFEN